MGSESSGAVFRLSRLLWSNFRTGSLTPGALNSMDVCAGAAKLMTAKQASPSRLSPPCALRLNRNRSHKCLGPEGARVRPAIEAGRSSAKSGDPVYEIGSGRDSRYGGTQLTGINAVVAAAEV